MRWLLLSLIVSCVGCAEGLQDELPEEESYNAPKISEEQIINQKPKIVCVVESIQSIGSCTLYKANCEDGLPAWALVCPHKPIGHVTNPPRPI